MSLMPKIRKVSVSELMSIPSTGDEDLDACLRECVRVMVPKNADYSQSHGDGSDRLYSFREIAEDVGISKEQVIYTFIAKHMSAIKRYCREGRVDSEGVRGRITDAINYLMLLSKMVAERDRLDRPDESVTEPMKSQNITFSPSDLEYLTGDRCLDCRQHMTVCACIPF